MTPDQAMELGRRAVACVPVERWPDWTPVEFCWRNYLNTGYLKNGRVFGWDAAESVFPLLNTPAGMGSLLAGVREAWGPHATPFANKYEPPEALWTVWNGRPNEDGYGHEVAIGPTEIEALVSALEAAAEAALRGEG